MARTNSAGNPGGFRVSAGFSAKIWDRGGFGRFGASKGFCANSQRNPLVPIGIFSMA